MTGPYVKTSGWPFSLENPFDFSPFLFPGLSDLVPLLLLLVPKDTIPEVFSILQTHTIPWEILVAKVFLLPVSVGSEIPFTENFLPELVHGLAYHSRIIQHMPASSKNLYTMQHSVFSPHCQFASNLNWLYHQRASAQFPYWVMKLICWCNICNGNDTLRLGGNRFLSVQDQLVICLYVKATSNGLLRDSWLPWWTRPSRGSAFIRAYRPNPSWVCGQLVTQTSNASGLAGNITSKALLLNTVQKFS